jgi:hypothetical protein
MRTGNSLVHLAIGVTGGLRSSTQTMLHSFAVESLPVAVDCSYAPLPLLQVSTILPPDILPVL